LNLANLPSPLLPLTRCDTCPDRMATYGSGMCEMCAAEYDQQLTQEDPWPL
jgi:hypothetical protein